MSDIRPVNSTQSRGSISYDRDILLSFSGSPMVISSIPDPVRMSKFAPVFEDSSSGTESGSVHVGQVPHSPKLGPVHDEKVMKVMSPIKLNPELTKPVTAKDYVVDKEKMKVEQLKKEMKEMNIVLKERQGSLRPDAPTFNPNQSSDKPIETKSQTAASNVPMPSISSLPRPMNGLPVKPTLCALPPNLPRWALSPSQSGVDQPGIAVQENGDMGGRRASSVMMDSVGSWRARAPSVSVTPEDTMDGQILDRRASMSMTPWARQKSLAPDVGGVTGSIATKISGSPSRMIPRGPVGPTPFGAFSFRSDTDSIIDAASISSSTARRIPIAGGNGGFSTPRVPGSIGERPAGSLHVGADGHFRGSLGSLHSMGAGGAVRVPKRPSLGMAELGELLGAGPM